MIQKLINNITGKVTDEPLMSVDIGASSIKVMEFDPNSDKPRLLSAGIAPSPAGIFTNNVISNPGQVSKIIRSLVEANGVKATKAVTAVSGPSAFSKKITTGMMDIKDLDENISFEASNIIPHSISDIHLDFQVLSTNGSNAMEVLVVAVKNDVVNSYINTVELAGLEPTIVDVDTYSLGTMFELSYPEDKEKTIAIANIGSRYSSINIVGEGTSLITGDVSVGGRLYTDALCETLNIKGSEAEQAKRGDLPENCDEALVRETIDRTTEHVSAELQRQIGFFWSAANTENTVEKIYVSGGGSLIPGLLEDLTAKAGIDCVLVEPFRNIEGLEGFDGDYLKEIAPSMGVSVGLAYRKLGDKKHMFKKESEPEKPKE